MTATQTHKVATDALETLGTHPIPDNSGRDAIHLAVEPVVAGGALFAGQPIKIVDGVAVAAAHDATGIVDPFLTARVQPGQKFWLVVYPRRITSLRHIWSHPDFPEETAVAAEDALDQKAVSERWIAQFAADIDQTVNRLMDAAETWLESREDGGWGEYTYDNTESYKAHWEKFPEFWRHYEIVTGKPVPEKDRESFFTCSC